MDYSRSTRTELITELERLSARVAELEEYETAREGMERTLRTERHFTDAALNAQIDTFLVFEPSTGKAVRWNRAFRELSGYSDEEIGSMRAPDSYHDDADLQKAAAAMEEIRRKGRVKVELALLSKDGTAIPTEYLGAGITDSSGSVEYVILVGRDITERKEAEKALWESQERYRTLVNNSLIGVCIIQDDEFRFANRYIFEMWGYEPDDLIGRRFLDFIHPDDRDPIADAMKRTLSDEEPRDQDYYRTFTKDGEIRWIETFGTPIEYRGRQALQVDFVDITDRKYAEEGLRRSEKRYRDLYEGSRDGYAMVDMQGKIFESNSVFRRMLGYTQAELQEKTYEDITPEKWHAQESNLLRTQLLVRDYTDLYEKEYIRKDGGTFPVELRTYLMRGENDKPEGMWAFIRDISERKQMEEEVRTYREELEELVRDRTAELNEVNKRLRAEISRHKKTETALLDSEEKARALLNSCTDSILLIDTDGTFIDLNETIARGIGKDVKDLLGTNAYEILPSDVARARRAKAEEVILTGEAVRFTDERAGMTFDINLYPVFGDDGTVERISIYAKDITEEIRAKENLRESEDRYARMLDSSHDVVAVIDENAKMLFANRAWRENSLYTIEDINTAGLFGVMHRDDREKVMDAFEKLKAGEVTRNVDFRVIGKNGEVQWRETNADPIPWPGSERAFVIVSRDVTERKRLESQLLQSSKLAAIGELAAGVAHEINNPIATVDIHAGLMREIIDDVRTAVGDMFVAKAQRYLETIEHQVRRCQSVTDKLLSFSRIRGEKRQVFHINELLKETVEFVTHLTDKNPSVELDFDERLTECVGDANQLQQVFVNLLNNALKAVEPEGRITVITRGDEDGHIRIEVGDSGPGIPPDIQDRIFDPFFTTSADGEGTGLGLSISYYIISQMKGEIAVESFPEQGSTFIISLPPPGDSEGGNLLDS
jgi:PAS domain S-box-containing protein